MSKDEKIGIFFTIMYFAINLLIFLASSAILAHWGMRLKHAVMFALFYCSWQELYIMLKAFLRGCLRGYYKKGGINEQI